MTEESISNQPIIAQPQNRSQTSLVFFLLLTIPLPFCLFIYHFIVWSMEQSAIISLSAKALEWSGLIGLALQAFVLSLSAGLLWRFTSDERFKTWFRGVFIASLIGFPTLLLRLLGANNDQLGSILQFIIAIVIFFILFRMDKDNVNWETSKLPFGLLISAIGILPFVIFGSLGSFGDVFLNLLAGLSVGLLVSILVTDSAENVLLSGLGVGAVVSLLASSFGYDGSQLILIVFVSAFSFGIAALLPSRSAVAVTVGFITFAGFAFFDPTELTIVLGDIAGLATNATSIALLIGWSTSVIALILRQVTQTSSTSRTKRAIGWSSAGIAWLVVIAIYFLFGNPGNYGDRLFIIFKEQADISDVANIEDREQRLTEAYNRLTEHANTTQADLRNIFDSVGIKYTPYYLQNSMEVQGGTLIRLFLLTRPEIDRVIPSPRLRAAPENSPSPGLMTEVDESVQWNIEMIGADKVWEQFGVQGEGIIIG
ncbi:MAG: hypothetical protein ACK40V_07715, partial [Anaerolineales bacterium]